MLQMIFKLFSVIILIRLAKALVGYDCSGPHPNSTLISLLETDQCKDPEEKIILHGVQLELLQLPEFTNINVLACRIELDNVVMIAKILNPVAALYIKTIDFIFPLAYPTAFTCTLMGNFNSKILPMITSRWMLPIADCFPLASPIFRYQKQPKNIIIVLRVMYTFHLSNTSYE